MLDIAAAHSGSANSSSNDEMTLPAVIARAWLMSREIVVCTDSQTLESNDFLAAEDPPAVDAQSTERAQARLVAFSRSGCRRA